MKHTCFYSLFLTTIMFLSGCGLIYTHKTVPLDLNLSQTSTAGDKGEANIKHIKYSYYVNLQWDSNAIGDIAKQNGLETVYYADLETFSIFRFLGIWNQYTVHVYGE